jgi:acyl-CoA dehydrogenase
MNGDAELIARSIGRLFADHVDRGLRERAEAGEIDAALWRRVVEGGYPWMLASEAAGGLGQPWRHGFEVLRAVGHWQVPLPLADTLVAAQLAALAGLALPEGPLTLIEQGCGNDLRLHDDAIGPRLSGTVHRVPWARHVQAALVSLADGRLVLLPLRGTRGLTLQAQVDLAGEPADTLRLDAVALPAPAHHGLALAHPAWTLGALARCAMMVGALESALAQAVRYAGERMQFGRPIGRNQAIQQQLALLAGDVAAARMATRVACDDAPGGAAALFGIAVAKVRCGEAATRGTAIVHQVHGAIGFTQEHPLHFATRRLWAWREQFGSDAEWAQRLGRAAIRAGAAGFWPALTSRQLA